MYIYFNRTTIFHQRKNIFFFGCSTDILYCNCLPTILIIWNVLFEIFILFLLHTVVFFRKVRLSLFFGWIFEDKRIQNNNDRNGTIRIKLPIAPCLIVYSYVAVLCTRTHTHTHCTHRKWEYIHKSQLEQLVQFKMVDNRRFTITLNFICLKSVRHLCRNIQLVVHFNKNDLRFENLKKTKKTFRQFINHKKLWGNYMELNVIMLNGGARTGVII